MANFDEDDIEQSLYQDKDPDLGELPSKQEEDTGKEYDASEEIANEVNEFPMQHDALGSSPTLSEIVPERPLSEGDAPVAAPSKLDKYGQYMAEYKRLQDKRRQNTLINGLFESGAMLGNGLLGIAGNTNTKMGIDHTPFERAQKVYDQPITDFEDRQKVEKTGIGLQDEKDLRDPASKISKAYRDYATKRLNMQLTDDVSAFDLQNLLKTAGKPQASKFATHPMINKKTGEAIEAKIDMTTGNAFDFDGKPLDASWTRNYAQRALKDPNSKEQMVFNPALGQMRGTLTGPSIKTPGNQITDSADAFNSVDARTKDSIDKEYRPTFNKLVEKPLQRLGHVPAIMERLDEAQHNPAALGQLKAELTRFDVGDNRLAQQEFEMFAKRHGYKGWADLVQDKTTGTISADFANDFKQTVNATAKALKADIDKKAEDQAKMINSRLPKDKKMDPKVLAPLLYGDYDPNHDVKSATPPGKARVRKIKTGQEGYILKEDLDKAVKSGQYQEIK